MIKCFCIVINTEVRKDEIRRGMERSVVRTLLLTKLEGRGYFIFLNCMWDENEFTQKCLSFKKLIKIFFLLSLNFFLVESKGSRNKIYLEATKKLRYSVREKRLYGRNKSKEKS